MRSVGTPLGVALAAYAAAFGLRFAALDATYERRAAMDLPEDVLVSPGPSTLQLLSFEHPYGLADLVWLTLLEEIVRGETARARRLEQGAYLATDLDRRYFLVYYAASLLLSSDLYEFDASDRVALRGREALPYAWQFPFLLAYNAYFAHIDPKRASELWLDAARLPDAPKWLASLAARAKFHAGAEKDAITMLEELIPVLPERQRLDAELRVKLLKSEFILREYDAACARYVEERGERPTAVALHEIGYVQAPPFDLLGNEIELDQDCRGRTKVIFRREDEAAERMGFMLKEAGKRK